MTQRWQSRQQLPLKQREASDNMNHPIQARQHRNNNSEAEAVAANEPSQPTAHGQRQRQRSGISGAEAAAKEAAADKELSHPPNHGQQQRQPRKRSRSIGSCTSTATARYTMAYTSRIATSSATMMQDGGVVTTHNQVLHALPLWDSQWLVVRLISAPRPLGTQHGCDEWLGDGARCKSSPTCRTICAVGSAAHITFHCNVCSCIEFWAVQTLPVLSNLQPQQLAAECSALPTGAGRTRFQRAVTLAIAVSCVC